MKKWLGSEPALLTKEWLGKHDSKGKPILVPGPNSSEKSTFQIFEDLAARRIPLTVRKRGKGGVTRTEQKTLTFDRNKIEIQSFMSFVWVNVQTPTDELKERHAGDLPAIAAEAERIARFNTRLAEQISQM